VKASVAVPVTDNGGNLSIDDGGNSITVDNGGTFAVQSTIAAGATNIAKAEDVASADADVGVPAMAVRKGTPANTSGTDGDYEMLQMSAGRLWTSSTIDAALPAGTNAIGKLAANDGVDIGDVTVNNTVTVDSELTTKDFDSGAGTETVAVSGIIVPASGGSATITGDAANGLDVDVTRVSGTVTIAGAVTNAGTFATQESQLVADDAAFTVGTTKVFPQGYLADETATDSVDEGDIGAARMTLDRKMIVTVEPHTAGGWDTFMATSADGSTALTATAQASRRPPGRLGGWYIYNPNATVAYVIIYNVAQGR
jgi:hypothetical protein